MDRGTFKGQSKFNFHSSNCLSAKFALIFFLGQPLIMYNALNPDIFIQGLFSGFIHPQAVFLILFGGQDFKVPGLALADFAACVTALYVLWTRSKRVSSDRWLLEGITWILSLVFLHVTATVIWIRLQHGFGALSWFR